MHNYSSVALIQEKHIGVKSKNISICLYLALVLALGLTVIIALVFWALLAIIGSESVAINNLEKCPVSI